MCKCVPCLCQVFVFIQTLTVAQSGHVILLIVITLYYTILALTLLGRSILLLCKCCVFVLSLVFSCDYGVFPFVYFIFVSFSVCSI